MRLKTYIMLLCLGTILAWSSFFLVLYLMRPDEIVNRFWFYFTFALSLFGSLHLVLYVWSAFKKKASLKYQIITGSERQSLVLTAFLISLLWLQTNEHLTWWIFLLNIGVLLIVEYVFLSYDERA